MYFMKKSTLVPFLSLAMLIGNFRQASAQYDFTEDPYYQNNLTYELGGSVGIMNCFTDLGGGKDKSAGLIRNLNISNTQPEASIYFSVVYKYAIALTVEATFGKVKAADNVLKNIQSSAPDRYLRNLSFQSAINEISLVTEIHPVFFKKFNEGENLPRVSPFLVGGIGYFSFNPQAKINNKLVSLQPLSTEGEGFSEYPDRKRYKLKQVNFPVGLGIKYKLSPYLNINLECIYRFLHTDYLDDVSTSYIDKEVFSKYFTNPTLSDAASLSDRQGEIDPSRSAKVGSQRGNPNKNDSYFTFGVKAGFIF